MTPWTDPPRLLDGELDASDPLARALRAGREDLPTDAALLKIVGGLAAAPLLGASTAKAAGAAGKWLSLKLASAVVATAVAGGGVVAVVQRWPSPAPTPPRVAPARMLAPRVEPTPTVAEQPPAEEPPEPPPPHRSVVAHAPAPPAVSEIDLLAQAQGALDSNPRGALALADRHQREFADGAYAQEREVIAIDALLRLGRSRLAADRAARFEENYPGSAHLARVRALIESSSQKNPGRLPLNPPNGP
jgi:hypothetical protein